MGWPHHTTYESSHMSLIERLQPENLGSFPINDIAERVREAALIRYRHRFLASEIPTVVFTPKAPQRTNETHPNAVHSAKVPGSNITIIHPEEILHRAKIREQALEVGLTESDVNRFVTRMIYEICAAQIASELETFTDESDFFATYTDIVQAAQRIPANSNPPTIGPVFTPLLYFT